MDAGFSAIVSLLREAGPWAIAIVFMYLWWEERKERRSSQTTCATLHESRFQDATTRGAAVVSVVEKNTQAMTAQSELIRSLLDRGRT